MARTVPEERLLERLRVLYADEWERIEPLIQERREQEPQSVPAWLVELIERRDHNSLERLAGNPKH